MKLKIKYTLCFFLFLSNLFAQNTEYYKVRIEKCFRTKGIVFKNFNTTIEIKNFQYNYSLSKEEVFELEDILNFYFLNRKSLKSSYKKFTRQYFGYINTNNEKCVFVNLINNKNPLKNRIVLGKGWKYNFQIIFDERNRIKIESYVVNLNLRKIELNY